ncbi:PTS glucitol/sorbitol transporter subunit IIA [Radiobacillus kanasensis]|uniref:PTS glucitol/sorbitol transporter subunit IIA n=1 Tax=Radiobacillus kanasensis TaxID=2844358 RepID=UPI001E60CBD6|nr:PTS glucitol/sorbitol transporter subunit IIA [Radiobacillus kanasensis]UFT98601.1 PTS glucitol/sorbitol transporter subunit IIA [Radiobacillus kanasensis]
MIIIYESVITELGKDIDSLLSADMLVIFNETAPDELKEISAIHRHEPWKSEVEVGDQLVIGDDAYEITCVGGKVNETLHTLGHCTISFSGDTETDMPGTLCVEKKALPILQEEVAIKFIRTK